MRRALLPASIPWRLLTISGLLATGACSGSLSCNSCGGAALDPIPGGFDPAARIERAAQVRLSDSGMQFIEGRFSDLVNAYASQACGAPEDPPCPSGFATTCDGAQQVCVDAAGDPQPLLGFEIEYTVEGDAVVCRDSETDPNRRDCFAWLRLEGLDLVPMGPDQLQAVVTARLLTTVIPIRYANSLLDLDCVVTLNSAESGSPLQDIEITVQLGQWSGPAGVAGGQLQIDVVDVAATIPDDDVVIAWDPIHGGTGDRLACAGLNASGTLKGVLISQLTGQLGSIIEGQLDELLGRTCDVSDPACPTGTTCNADLFCEYDERVVPTALGLEGRLDFASLLGGFGGGQPGQTDVDFLVGGTSQTDSAGLTIGALAGAELVTLDAACAQDLPSPRLRPSFATPEALPTDGQADLDFDGTPETNYMVAAGLSEAFMDQVVWSLYGSGLFCQEIDASQVDLLNTGSLGLLVPSLEQLTHADKYPWAVYPAALTLTPSGEPVLRLGSGETVTTGAEPTLLEPLMELVLDDVRLDFYALLEERWMRVMTVEADLSLGFGAFVNPANEVEVVIGDVSQAISDVRVMNAELLAESPQDLADAIPALVQLALPQITGAIPSIPLPGAAELAGFDLQVLGVRGVEGQTPGLYPNVAVYADLDFNPALAGNLTAAAETRVDDVRLRRDGADAELWLDVAGEGEGPLEFQVRVDGGAWSTFVAGPQVHLRRAALAVPGVHHVEVRARVAGEYRSLDPTPVQLDVVMDDEAPRLDVRVLASGLGLRVRAADRVSGERVALSLVSASGARRLELDERGYVDVPELAAEGRLAVRATDEQGLSAEVVVREGSVMQVPEVEPAVAADGGCRCVDGGSSGLTGLLLFGLSGLAGLVGRRR